ncbi:MAG: NAD(P)(+) transhydrogenase (Re/Si-specific) subunit beta [Deltaproteobacteria bacterium]|nr:NAD(P)(+) transhydrogenase (Re/Si-specific) subunit beta [Deltaproteobacteria bacterium]
MAAVLFIIGIKMLSSPESAVKGNILSAIGMALAVGATMFTGGISDYTWIMIGIVAGTLVGVFVSYWVKMTAMPQMVALYNGLGGASSALVALAEYYRGQDQASPFIVTVIMLSILVGWVTLTGSLVAYAKLQELISGKPTLFPMQHLLNLLLVLSALACGVLFVLDPTREELMHAVTVISLLLGVLLVIPIGGADMPVVIALLNSYSGIAVSFTGFVLSNNMLIIAGSLVGASGIFLTNEMCKGMHRSIWNVLFGGFGAGPTGGPGSGEAVEIPGGGSVKPYSVDDAANVLESASLVILVPGYGMAAAQAQHAVRSLGEALQTRGVDVKYAIHPVAGRMPGHMNVLLAEANVPYDILFDMDQINDEFPTADVALVIGANDVVNPAANEDPSSPIYGMPILNAEKARTVMVLKRSMNPGFAGIENMLFYRDNTMMVFGDAKSTLNKMVEALKSR